MRLFLYRDIKEDDSNLVWICEACHRTIHAYYTENELRDRLSTVDALKADEKINSFAKWRAKHPLGKPTDQRIAMLRCQTTDDEEGEQWHVNGFQQISILALKP